MKFKVCELNGGRKVVFYTEDKMYDYVFNHVVALVHCTDAPEDVLRFSLYTVLPDKVIASDRLCIGGIS